MDEHDPEGPNVGGALHKCLLCGQRRCLRHEACCNEPCGKMCFLGCGVEAPENCERCVRKASRELAKLKGRWRGALSAMRAKRLGVIKVGAAGITVTLAREILKPSSLIEDLIRDAAGGGEAGALAFKEGAVIFASAMEKVSQAGGDVRKYYPKAPKNQGHTERRGGAHKIPAPAAIAAVDAVATNRVMEPMYADVPAETLTIVTELFAEAGHGVKDALVLADLLNKLEYVNGLIVKKVRSSRTHHHGWRTSKIEALEAFARAEAEKAIKLVLSRSRAAVAARQAKEPPKKKRARAARRASEAKKKAAKAKGTYKNPHTGDTKKYFKQVKKQVNLLRKRRAAYNKVERKGPGACSDLEVRRHAEHKKHLETCAAFDAVRRASGKKRL